MIEVFDHRMQQIRPMLPGEVVTYPSGTKYILGNHGELVRPIVKLRKKDRRRFREEQRLRDLAGA